MSKIIPFDDKHLEFTKQAPLSTLMIKTLKNACEKQSRGITFGPGDIKGSSTALIKRGLIVNKDITVSEHIESHWQVTPEAIQMLENLGIQVPC